jgi:hypothetical protein
MNLHRRHLTESQRGMIAAQMNLRGNVAPGQATDESSEKSGMLLAEATAVMPEREPPLNDNPRATRPRFDS